MYSDQRREQKVHRWCLCLSFLPAKLTSFRRYRQRRSWSERAAAAAAFHSICCNEKICLDWKWGWMRKSITANKTPAFSFGKKTLLVQNALLFLCLQQKSFQCVTVIYLQESVQPWSLDLSSGATMRFTFVVQSETSQQLQACQHLAQTTAEARICREHHPCRPPHPPTLVHFQTQKTSTEITADPSHPQNNRFQVRPPDRCCRETTPKQPDTRMSSFTLANS